jgi:peptide/nickel transport system substrate-binding protein
MAITRSIRIFFLITIELAKKYTRSLILGFFVGLTVSLLFWKTFPYLGTLLVERPERIGLVGDFSPSNLPLSVQSLISKGLTTIGPNGEAEPALASKWEATDSGKTFIFTLRNDLKWQGGRTVTSHDVNYNIRGVTLVPRDPQTIVAKLEYAFSPFPTLVSKPLFLPGLKGFGDYSVQGIQIQGDSIKSLQLYPTGNLLSKPKFFSFYRTENQAMLAFQLGEIDTLQELSTPSALANWGGAAVRETVKYDRIVGLYFNMHDPLLEDKNTRQGLGYAVPTLPYERAYTPISKTSWAYTDNVRKFSYDATQAKKLFKDTPLGSPSAAITISTFASYLDVAQSIASAWTALGIKTSVRVESTVPQNYQVLLSAQDVSPDPDQYPFWHSTQSQTNITGYVNVKIDKLLEDGRQEIDQAKRKTIYADFQRRLVEDAPAIFLFYPKTYTVSRTK